MLEISYCEMIKKSDDYVYGMWGKRVSYVINYP